MDDKNSPTVYTHAFALRDGRQSETAADIARGTMRMLRMLAFRTRHGTDPGQ